MFSKLKFRKSKSQDKTSKKSQNVAIAGTSSVATAGAGIALMAVGGPTGVVVGGIILGAGLSGAIATTQQAMNKKQSEFNYKKWGVQAGIGAAGGLIAAPISLAGGVLAGTTGTIATSAAAKMGIQVGTDVVSGIAAGAGTKMISNHFEGHKISKGVLNQAFIGGLTGGLASGAGQGASKIISSVDTAAGRIAVHATTGAIISGTTGALGCLLNNIMNLRKIDKGSFLIYLEKCGASKANSTNIWNDLVSKQYILDNEFTQLCEKGIQLRKEFIDFQDIVNEVYLLTKDIWQDVWQSAASSAALGGVVTGIVSTSRVLNQKDARTVNKTAPNLISKKNERKISENDLQCFNLEDFEADEEFDVNDWVVLDGEEEGICFEDFTIQVVDVHRRGCIKYSQGILDEGQASTPHQSSIRKPSDHIRTGELSDQLIRERRETIIRSYLEESNQSHNI